MSKLFDIKKNDQEVTDVVEESKEVEKMGFFKRNKNRIFIGAISTLAVIAGVITVSLFNNDSDEVEEDLDDEIFETDEIETVDEK